MPDPSEDFRYRKSSDFYGRPFTPRKWPLPPPTVAFDAAPFVYWKINAQWMGHVLGFLAGLYREDSWTGTADEIYNATVQGQRLVAQDVHFALYDLRQTGILIERQDVVGGTWSTLYDPRAQVLIKLPTALYQNTVLAPAGVAALTLNSAAARAATNDALLNIHAGIGAPGAIFYRDDNSTPTTSTILIQHNLGGGVQPGLDFLRAVDQVGNKFGGINAYGNPALRRYTALPTPTVDHYGSLVMLNSGFAPDDGIWYGDYNPTSGTYIWRQGVGPTGATGATGHGVDMLDPARQAVLYPNQSPEIVVDDALPAKTFIGFKLPRAVQFSLASTIVRKPNQNPTFAMSSDIHGDQTLQAGIPRAQKIVGMSAHDLPPGSDPTVDYSENPDGDSIIDLGIPAGTPGSSYGFDDVLPGLGDHKDYSFLVPADTLFNLPFRVPAGSTISNIVGSGYWNIHTATNDIVVGSAGTVILGVVEGNLRIGKKADQLTGLFAYEAAVGTHVFTDDTWVSFEMQKYYPTSFGYGWLWVSFRLTRAADDDIHLSYTLGASGPTTISNGDEFDFVLGDQGGGFWNGQVIFDVGVTLSLISVTGWTQGPYSGATWDYYRANGSYGGYYPAPVAVPGEAASKYGVNSGSACTVRLRATKA